MMKLLIFILNIPLINSTIRNTDCPSDSDAYNIRQTDSCFKYAANEWIMENGLYSTCCCNKDYELINNKCKKEVSCPKNSLPSTDNSKSCFDGMDHAGMDHAGMDHAGNRCWEAYTPNYNCDGYKNAGYTCVGKYCSAMNPSGEPHICAKQSPIGWVLDKQIGRCKLNAQSKYCCCNKGFKLNKNQCVECNCNNNNNLVLGIIGMIVAPVLLPTLMAAPGLYGAAAYTNGMAALGGGAITTGGLGMAGGQAVSSIIGKTIGENLGKVECTC